MKGAMSAALALALLAASPALAETELSLRDALLAGLSQDPQLKQAALDVEKADVALAGARAERLSYSADLSVGDRLGVSGLLSTQTPVSANAPIANGTLQARVPLFTGFRVSRQIDQATAGVEAGQAARDQVLQGLVWQITSAYWETRRARLHEVIQTESVTKARQARDVVQQSFRIGQANANELDRAEVTLLNEESSALRASDEHVRARDQLATLIQRDLSGTTLLDPPAADGLAVPPPDAAVAAALAHRPDVRSARAVVAGRAASLDVARADRWPQLDLVSAYQHGNNPFIATSQNREVLSSFVGTWDARLNLSYHLFDNGVIERNVSARQLEAQAAEAQLTAAERAAALEIRQALARLELSRRRIALGDRSVALATKNLAWLEGRFKFGYALLTELNEARANLNVSRNQRVDAQIDFQLATAALAKAMGTLEAPTGAKE